MVEVNEDEVKNLVIPHWKKIDAAKDIQELRRLYKISIEEVCGRDVAYGTMDPFMRRPIMTVHAGASPGDEDCSDLFLALAHKVGFLTAKHRWTLFYGGGETGGMGKVAKGFYAGLNAFGRADDQYSVQVIPADFVLGVKSLNNNRPKNEGLCTTTDAALVMPDFMMRRHILNFRAEVAITKVGSLGSLDEWSDIAVSIKTGLSDVRLYTLNPYVEKLKGKFYAPLNEQIENSVTCGLQNRDIYNHLKFMNSPEEIFADLEKNNVDPEQKYQARRQRFGFTPGIPRPVPSLV
jgi:predicted Rossmann-fold nucleotide-binding protein